MAPFSPRRMQNHSRTDIVVLTVIPSELLAARDALGLSQQAREKDDAGTISYRGRIRSSLAQRDYEVLLTCIGRAGNPHSAAAVQDVLLRHRPHAVLLMGIAAGLRGRVQLGEVVISERVVSYEPEAVVRTSAGTAHAEPRPEIRTTPHAMHQDVVHYEPGAARLKERFTRGGWAFPLPGAGQEAFYQEHVAAQIRVKRATLAAGDKLLRDPGRLLELRNLHEKIEASEMEAAGLMEACERSQVPWLVIRGISDFGDETKDDRFHDFAARTAATVLADFIVHGLELPPPPRQQGWAAKGLALSAAAGLGLALWVQRQEPQPVPPTAVTSPAPAQPAGTAPPAPAVDTRPVGASSTSPPARQEEERRLTAPTPTLTPTPKGKAPRVQPHRAASSSKAPEQASRPAEAGPAESSAVEGAPGVSAPVVSAPAETAPAGSAPTGSLPRAKVQVGPIEMGSGGRASIGNTQGVEQRPDTEVKAVKCLDNCTIEIGNQTSH